MVEFYQSKKFKLKPFVRFCVRVANRVLLFREDELVKRASSLVVNSGAANDADLGPVISRQVCFQTHVCLLILSYLPFLATCWK
jgi:hypothetical protein